MTLNASHVLLVVSILVVLSQAYRLVTLEWTRPLAHGHGFFLAFEVPHGFYEGPGAAWLGRYRAVLVVELGLEVVALALFVLAGRERWLPFWAAGAVLVRLGSTNAFGLILRRALGEPTAQPAVAMAFEARRLRDYVSWLVEATMAVLFAIGWLRLLTHGHAGVRWVVPVTLTYTVLALFALKIIRIRAATPLPTERTEAHYRYFDADRRQQLRVIDRARWFFTYLFAGYAVQHSWSAAQAMPWLTLVLLAGAAAMWLFLVVGSFRGARRLGAEGRELRPLASWFGPSQTHPQRASLAWAASFLIGLVVLTVILWRW